MSFTFLHLPVRPLSPFFSFSSSTTRTTLRDNCRNLSGAAGGGTTEHERTFPSVTLRLPKISFPNRLFNVRVPFKTRTFLIFVFFLLQVFVFALKKKINIKIQILNPNYFMDSASHLTTEQSPIVHCSTFFFIRAVLKIFKRFCCFVRQSYIQWS